MTGGINGSNRLIFRSTPLLMLLLTASRAFVLPIMERRIASTVASRNSALTACPVRHLAAASIDGGNGPRVYEDGQDPKELFDLFEPPTPEERAGAKVQVLRPLGLRKIRSKVHADGDWHRAAHIWLVDDYGGLLLQRRSAFKDTFPDRWDVSVGGHIEAGEDEFPTAVRELEEELGLVGPLVTKLQKLFTLACTNRGSTERHGAFTCNEYQELFLLPVGEKHDLSQYKYPPGEVSDLRVMHYKDLEAKLAAADPEYVPRMAHYRKHLWAYLDETCKKR